MLTLNVPGPPTTTIFPSQSFPTGETAIDSNGQSWYCSAGGAVGTWVSGAPPVYSNPSFTTNTPRQLSTTQDMILYIQVNTAVTMTANVGPTSTPANKVADSPASPAARPTFTIYVRAGEYVNVVCATMASLTFIAVNAR